MFTIEKLIYGQAMHKVGFEVASWGSPKIAHALKTSFPVVIR